jgi:hypothetical protein
VLIWKSLDDWIGVRLIPTALIMDLYPISFGD